MYKNKYDKDGHGGPLHGTENIPPDKNVINVTFPVPVEKPISAAPHLIEVACKVFFQDSSIEKECRA